MNKYKQHLKRLFFELSLVTLGVVPIILVFLFYNAPESQSLIEKAQKSKPKIAVQGTYSILEYYYDLHKKGVLSEEEAKNQAKKLINQFRYEKHEYVWINDLTPKMIMHPYKPALNDKFIGDIEDPKGQKLFVKMVQKVKESGEGHVAYMWSKPDLEIPVDKISYVKLFEPWGWVLGSGIYMDDVKAMQTAFMLRNIKWYLFAIMLTLSCSMFLSLRTFKSFVLPVEKSIEIVRISSENLYVNSKKMKDSSNVVNGEVASQSLAIEEFNKSINSVSENAISAKNIANEVKVLTEDFQKDFLRSSRLLDNLDVVLKKLLDNQQENIKSNNRIITFIEDFKSKFNEIFESVKAIEDIVFQTKLLSFNASVEAARAGEYGKGFSVVAEEIGNLAETSGVSGKRIMSLVNNTLGSIEAMVDQLKKVNREIEKRTGETSSETTEIVNDFIKIFKVANEKNNLILEKQDDADTEVSSVSLSLNEMKLAADTLNKSNLTNEGHMQSITDIAVSLNDQSEKLLDSINELAKKIHINLDNRNNLVEIDLEKLDEVNSLGEVA